MPRPSNARALARTARLPRRAARAAITAATFAGVITSQSGSAAHGLIGAHLRNRAIAQAPQTPPNPAPATGAPPAAAVPAPTPAGAATPRAGAPQFQADTIDLYDLATGDFAAHGNVRLTYMDFEVTADRIEGNINREMVLSGNARLTGHGANAYADAIHIYTTRRAYRLDDPRATLAPEFLDNRVLQPLLVNGGFLSGNTSGYGLGEHFDATTCIEPRKHYLLQVGSAELFPHDRLVLRRVGVVFFGVRLVVLPQLVIPLDRTVRRPRTNYMPEFGYNVLEGYFARFPYTFAEGRDAAAFVRLDITQRRGLGGRIEEEYLTGKQPSQFDTSYQGYSGPSGGFGLTPGANGTFTNAYGYATFGPRFPGLGAGGAPANGGDFGLQGYFNSGFARNFTGSYRHQQSLGSNNRITFSTDVTNSSFDTGFGFGGNGASALSQTSQRTQLDFTHNDPSHGAAGEFTINLTNSSSGSFRTEQLNSDYKQSYEFASAGTTRNSISFDFSLSRYQTASFTPAVGTGTGGTGSTSSGATGSGGAGTPGTGNGGGTTGTTTGATGGGTTGTGSTGGSGSTGTGGATGNSSNGTLTERLDTTFQLQHMSREYSLQLNANTETNLSGSRSLGLGFGTFEKLPELQVAVDTLNFRGGWLKNLPATLNFGAGAYSEPGSNTQADRFLMGFLIQETPILKGRTEITAGGGFEQRFYSDGAAEYLLQESSRLRQHLGGRSGFDLDYTYAQPEGGTPFLFDTFNRQHSLRLDAGYLDDRHFQLTLGTGYDLTGRLGAAPWQLLANHLMWRPSNRMRYDGVSSYDPNHGRLLSVANTLRFRGPRDFAVDLLADYNPQEPTGKLGKLDQLAAEFDIPLGRSWRIAGLLRYNGALGIFESRNLQVTHDWDCMQAIFTYTESAYGGSFTDRQFYLSIRIKAFPFFRSFARGPAGQSLGVGFGSGVGTGLSSF